MKSTKKHIDLSIVIVNYNVCYFLEQCLNSVFASQKDLNIEVFVVDNNSVDRSIEMVKSKFPKVHCIENKTNQGFSKANNQALNIASGTYALLLNPDTVIEEDTLTKCFEHMETNKKIGGLGVRMLDGKGNFLPESKRGFPSPSVSFFKIFGFSKIFPKSKLFGRYHLGFLDENEIHEVDVLSGAFMFLRMETLRKIGFLDPIFFMYGEDIDLSYRIQKFGYTNCYFPKTKIIHYKGESTKKGSVNYVFIFYKAMILFARKHFSGNNMKVFIAAIYFAIYLRAAMSVIKRIWQNIKWPLLDSTVLFIGLIALTNQWKMRDIHFPQQVFFVQIPAYSLIWIFFSYLFGIYDRIENLHKVWKSWFFSTLFILVVYGLLPKNLQFSRLFIIIGSVWFLLQFYLSRFFYILVSENRIGFPKIKNKTFAIVAQKDEFLRIKKIIQLTNAKYLDIIHIGVDKLKSDSIGHIDALPQLIKVYKIDELIFSAKNVESKKIIEIMIQLPGNDVEFKIAQPETEFLIGSNSIHTSGDFYEFTINQFKKPENLRIKRIYDVVMGLSLLIISPFIVFLQKNIIQFYSNIVNVLLGNKTIVGVHKPQKSSKLKSSVINVIEFKNEDGTMNYSKIEFFYSKNYSMLLDFQKTIMNIRNLGN